MPGNGRSIGERRDLVHHYPQPLGIGVRREVGGPQRRVQRARGAGLDRGREFTDQDPLPGLAGGHAVPAHHEVRGHRLEQGALHPLPPGHQDRKSVV